jgi:hypothetical protein
LLYGWNDPPLSHDTTHTLTLIPATNYELLDGTGWLIAMRSRLIPTGWPSSPRGNSST